MEVKNMLKKIIFASLALIAAAALIVTALSFDNGAVLAAEKAANSEQAENGEETNDDDFGFCRRNGQGMQETGMRGWWRDAEDTDGDGKPNLPEGVTRPCDTDGDGKPDMTDDGSFGFGRRNGRGMNGEGRRGECDSCSYAEE
jgi:hypothetical protein